MSNGMSVLLFFLFLATVARRVTGGSPKGAIVHPTSGTAISPGSSFNFTYNVLADYSVSTYWYHVWLVDPVEVEGQTPSLSDIFSSGYYFGRFDYANWPAVPYAKNPCPPQLTMPDFSKSQGAGYSAGEAAENVEMQLVVIEEWGNSQPAIGHRLHVSSVDIIYNATFQSA